MDCAELDALLICREEHALWSSRTTRQKQSPTRSRHNSASGSAVPILQSLSVVRSRLSLSCSPMALISSKHRRTGDKAHTNARKANAVGYAKRKSRQVKTVSGIADVYDHTRKKDKRDRANVSLTLDRDERLGNDDDEEEEEDMASSRTRPRLVGENDDDVVGSDEDEEIDSDDAFEDGDEERFAGLRFSSSKVCGLPTILQPARFLTEHPHVLLIIHRMPREKK